MPEDEFRTDLQWPTDPLGERHEPAFDSDAEAPATPELSREVVSEELDRVADRILEVVQALRSDLDTNLDDVRGEVAGLRQAVDDLLERPPAPAGGSQPVPSLAPVLEEIAQVRAELTSLKRRISLRAEAEADTTVLTDEQLDRIARAVAGLLSPSTERAR